MLVVFVEPGCLARAASLPFKYELERVTERTLASEHPALFKIVLIAAETVTKGGENQLKWMQDARRIENMQPDSSGAWPSELNVWWQEQIRNARVDRAQWYLSLHHADESDQ